MAARDNIGARVGSVVLSQAALLAVFQIAPAAAVLFLGAGFDPATRIRLILPHIYAVAPLGLVSVAAVAAMWHSLGRAAARLTPATAEQKVFEPRTALQIRVFPPVAAAVALACGTSAYIVCAVVVGFGAGSGPGVAVLAAGVASAIIYALVSWAAAERYLGKVFAYLTVKKVRFKNRRYLPLTYRAVIAGGVGAAALITLAAIGAGSGGAARAVVAAVLVAVAAGAGYVVSGRLTAPLRGAASARPVTYYLGDEIEELTAACRSFKEEARRFDGNMRRVAKDLDRQGALVKESLIEQASIASEQASAISETSVTMKELAGTVKQTASRAEEISGRVDSSVKLVRTAEDQILANAKMIDKLATEAQTAAKLAVALNESARRMDEIAALVNDLAEQSTVLALNAAIEAAKAGEFGRGFSAVAREVKSLAGSSKEGTEEIRKVLHDIREGTVKTVTSARDGAERSAVLRGGAATAKGLVEEIVPLVEEIGRMSKQIAASARQQSLGLEQVTTAVDNINDAAAEALDQSKAIRGVIDSIIGISSRLSEETDASYWWRA